MTKRRSTKSALLSGVLALILCVSMLLGTTFAWFTDSVTSANNIIQSGNLDVELYYQTQGESDWTRVTDTTNIFQANALWEPGHTEVVKLKVVNEGSLALKYLLSVNVAKETGSVTAKGDSFKLSDFIKFGIVDGAQNYTRDEAVAAVDATATALNAPYNERVTLEAKNDSDTDERIVTMVVYMPTSVGNEANYAKDAAIPTIHLGINLIASQITSEEDSFDADYDAGAWDNGVSVSSVAELQAALSAGESVTLTQSLETDTPLNVPAPAATTFAMRAAPAVQTLNLNGYTLKSSSATVLENNGIFAIVGNGEILSTADFAVRNNGTLTVDGATISAIYNAGSLEIENAKIANESDTIPAIQHCGTELLINGGSFSAKTEDKLIQVDNAGVVIKGGTFSSDVIEDLLADHYEIVEKDGAFVVQLGPVAKVGNTSYYTIAEAIANWTPNTTLTLLNDVELTDVITLKSTEHHILNLDTYTMTAAAKKNAIEITPEGAGRAAKSCLTVNANANNPGGITATGKNCIYYRKTNGIDDRLMVTINGGIFNASSVISSSSNNGGQACPYYVINGGTFNGSVSLTKAMLKVTGGTFNGMFSCTGDSTAYRLISGGTFKAFTFMTADAASKFVIGSAKEVYDVGVYVNDNGYLVVGGPVITEAGDKFVASSANYGGWSSYLKYSSAKSKGLYYTKLSEAFADNSKTTSMVSVYTDAIDMTDTGYKGTILISDALTVTFKEGTVPAWKVAAKDDKQTVIMSETTADGIVTRNYQLVNAISTSDALVKAISNAKAGDKLYLAAGDFELRFTNNTAFNVNDLTLIGTEGTNLSITSSEVWYGRIQGSGVTFENITFKSNVGATGAATYNNCTFDGDWAICASSNNEKTYFNNCTINGCLNTSVDFSAGDTYVNGSTVAKAEFSGSATMYFENCTIGELISWDMSTVLTNCEVTTLDDSHMEDNSIVIN